MSKSFRAGPEVRRADAVEAFLAAHPYEEPAFDLYPLANVDPRSRAGAVGCLAADPERCLAELGVAPVFRCRQRGERVAVSTGRPSPCHADVVIAPAGEPDLLAPTIEA